MKLKNKFESRHRQVLTQMGVDPSIFGHTEDMDLEKLVIDFKPEVAHIPMAVIGCQKQIDTSKAWLEDPLKQKGVLAVSSYPTDMRAKLFAAHVILRARHQYQNSDAGFKGKYSSPSWTRLYSRFGSEKELLPTKPSLIVCSNITEESTSYRFEYLRDMLERYHDVPRIVVMGSKTDPVTLLSKKLYMPIKGSVFIGPNNMVNTMMEI